MSRPRDSVILESAKYVEAIDKLRTHLSSRQFTRLTAGDPVNRRGNVKLFVDPFGIDLDVTQKAQAFATTRAWAGRGSVATGRVDEIANAGTDSLLRLDDFSPARIVWGILKANPNRVVPDSTGIAYIDYVDETNSIPFGKNGATDTYADAVDAIRTTSATAFTNAIVNFQPEEFGRAWS